MDALVDPVVRKYPSGLLHNLGEPKIVVAPSSKVVHGDDRNGPRMAEFVLGDANEQAGPSTRPMNRDSGSQSSRGNAVVVV